MKSDRVLWEERGEIWAVLHVYASTHARPARITRAHYRDFALFAFTTFTQGDCFIAILGEKNVGDKRKNMGDFLEKVPRFLEKVQCFWRKVREFFLGLRIYRNSSAESLKSLKSLDSLKSLNFSWIVQTLCAKDGNKDIFTSSSLRGDLVPSKRSFWREFRVRFITL